MRAADLDSYIATGRTTVRGWLYPADAHLLAVAAEIATDRGDLVEVGAFFGASAIELGYLRRAGDRLVVIDPFEDDPDDRWAPNSGLSMDGFLANWRRFHADDPTVIVGLSGDVMPTLPARSARLVHVDGAHHYDVVLEDVAQAIRIATPNGVLVFDDVGPWQWPSVAAAVWKAVTDGHLVPLAITTAKLYATPSGSELAPEELVARARARGMRTEGPHLVCGHEMWEAYAPPPTASARLRELAAGMIPPTLRAGARKLSRARAHRAGHTAVHT
ncbi:MAG: hypothetical protein GEV08_13510 [Acidimicrobiia bacterium]|nr:hypothetical protein [Acidimicrobiia bacterium]